MEQTFINSIDDLRRTVKVNASLRFEILEPYLQDAFDKYIIPYLGERLVERLDKEATTGGVTSVKALAARALGPLAVALASPELGVLIGDSGHTVSRNDKFTVASDQKIARSEESMQERGWTNLDKTLEYLADHARDFPEWEESRYRRNLSRGHYLNTAREFQEQGKVNIGYSSLTFERFRPLLEALEMKLSRWIGRTLDDSLKEILRTGTEDPLRLGLARLVRAWLAMSVAKLHTSQVTRAQRTAAGQVEFRPVICPLYADPTDNGNFYAEQVTSLEAAIDDYLASNAAGLGLPTPERNDFNSRDKHIFVS